MFISNWPSCGRRRSTMFMSAMILMRLTSAWPISGGSSTTSLERTVDAEPDAHAVLGRLDVHVGGAVAQRLRDDLVDDLDDRRVRVDDFVARAYLQILLNAGGTAFDDKHGRRQGQQTAEQDLRETFKRFEPTARYGAKITKPADRAPPQHQARDPQLPAAVNLAGRNATTSSPASWTRRTRTSGLRRAEESSLREALRAVPRHARADDQHAQKTSKLAGGARARAQRLRPFARELAPALRKTQPFFRETTPIIRTRSGRSRATCSPRCATSARRRRPGGRHAAAVAHASACSTASSTCSPTTRPARGARSTSGPRGRPRRRHDVRPPGRARADPPGHRARELRQLQRLEQVILGNPQLGLRPAPEPAAGAAGLPAEPAPGRLPSHDQAGPQPRPDLRDGRVHAVVLRHPRVPLAQLRRLGAAAAEGLPGDASASPRPRSSRRRPTCASPACAWGGSRRRSRTSTPG